MTLEKKSFTTCKAKDICPSSVLPPRTNDPELTESVKTMGVQQPLIVRPHPSLPDKFELINGRGRLNPLDPDQEVYLDVRKDATDADVFKISGATFKRTERNAYENALFYTAYVEAVKKETKGKGALSRVAKEALISESLLSQYLSINELFVKLSQLSPESEFKKLKSMGINKLYELASLIDHAKLLEVANEIEEKADNLTVEGVAAIVNSVKNADIEEIMKQLDADDTVSPTPIAQAYVPTLKAYPKDLSEKIAKMLKDLGSIMQQVKTETLPKLESASPENRNILEKVSVNLRRLLFYLRKLQKKQKTAGENEINE